MTGTEIVHLLHHLTDTGRDLVAVTDQIREREGRERKGERKAKAKRTKNTAKTAKVKKTKKRRNLRKPRNQTRRRTK
jgi:hypothetical protein